jgi:sugar phosphate isomerase/epimerase
VRFGISTHLVHDERLTREHLGLIADFGFEAVELFASRSHFDYHDPRAIDALATWLDDLDLTLHSVHAPIAEKLVSGVWHGPYSNASQDAKRRATAIEETARTLDMAATLPYAYLVAHVGVPESQAKGPGDNSREAARRSLEALTARAADREIVMALEVIPNELSAPESLVRLLQDDLEADNTAVCLDVGHAHLMGDVIEAVETLSGHLATTHVHDNDGREDAHRLPLEGSIDWPGTLMALQKVGYDGVLMFELAATTDLRGTLERARAARHELESMRFL